MASAPWSTPTTWTRPVPAVCEGQGLRLTHVIDTHVHADHRSGGRRLAELAGARYSLHRSAEVAFPFEPLDDGQEIELGNTRIRVLHTPGHSPESICLLVTDLRRGPEPWFLLTGDTLFSGAVGRPDLPGRARENAALLHGSLSAKVLGLPGELEVYPAHYSGSVCGAGLSGKPSTTLAFERRWNPLLSLPRDEFVTRTTEGIPDKPAAMETILRFNRGLEAWRRPPAGRSPPAARSRQPWPLLSSCHGSALWHQRARCPLLG